MHFVANGASRLAAENLATFRTALAKRGGPAQPKAGFAAVAGHPATAGTVLGCLRNIVVADTDAEAERIARPAAEFQLGNLNWLRAKHGYTDFTNRLRTPGGAKYEDLVAEGVVIAGSPDTVVKAIERQNVELGGLNYLLAYMMFGTMALPDALRSLDLFSHEVMPRIAHL